MGPCAGGDASRPRLLPQSERPGLYPEVLSPNALDIRKRSHLTRPWPVHSSKKRYWVSGKEKLCLPTGIQNYVRCMLRPPNKTMKIETEQLLVPV